MSTNPPRGFEVIRAAIAAVHDLGELDRFRAFAHEQWGDDPAYRAKLATLFDQRQSEIEGRGGTQLPLPLDDYEELDRDAG